MTASTCSVRTSKPVQRGPIYDQLPVKEIEDGLAGSGLYVIVSFPLDDFFVVGLKVTA